LRTSETPLPGSCHDLTHSLPAPSRGTVDLVVETIYVALYVLPHGVLRQELADRIPPGPQGAPASRAGNGLRWHMPNMTALCAAV